MATLYHYYSTNEQPRHENCPIEAESCEWRKAEARGEEKNYDLLELIHQILKNIFFLFMKNCQKKNF